MHTRNTRKILKTLLVPLSICATPAFADDDLLLRLTGDAGKAMSEAREAHENLQKVQEIVKSIDDGQTPAVQGNPYANLAQNFRTAASDLRQAPLPTDFDETPYQFSLDELVVYSDGT